MSHPLNSRRYAELCDRINGLLGMVNEYLTLRIREMKEKEKEKGQKDGS